MLYAILGLALLGLDQWVKAWTAGAFAAPIPPYTGTADAPLPLLPGLVELTRVHNYGAAWSSFSGMRWLLVAVTSVIVLAVLALLAKKVVRHPLGRTACVLIAAGGLGNLADRARLGYVVDMFNFQFMRYPVFNVADICVVCGAILGAVYYLKFYEPHDGKGAGHGDPDADG